MPCYICQTCGVQHAASEQPPERCAICDDERQYVGWGGQRWTTLEALRADHSNRIEEEAPGLAEIGTEPGFAIGQRALLVAAPGGNILWDAISLLDDATVEAVRARGGIAAIAVSHPHFYASMVEWSRAFGGAPIWLHADDRQWVMRPDAAIVFWEGETRQIGEGVMLIRCGGHFAGSAALHWAAGAGGRGALLTGDTIKVSLDKRWVSFMRSYPNLIPLSAAAVRRIVEAVAPFDFERIYGGWWDHIVREDAKGAVARSAARYLKAIGQ
ncbi:MAG TPA: MBL fold metallo-hydrolase [Bryobacterales bacterium]|nr:MBL fold metallo-hydrolase [Bryobacterales bacterium]